MARLYKFLIAEGFKVEYITDNSMEVYFKKDKKKYPGKKSLTLTVYKESDGTYRTHWESKKYGDYRIDAKRQGFIFEELKRYGFERANDI